MNSKDGEATHGNGTELHSATSPIIVQDAPTDRTKKATSRWVLGTCAGVIWFLIYSAGILLPSQPHRAALGVPADKTIDEAAIGRFTKELLEAARSTSQKVSDQEPQTNAFATYKLLARAVDKEEAPKVTTTHSIWESIGHFFAAMFLYTPINVAFLALLAGFIGGCASNESDKTDLERKLALAEKTNDAVTADYCLRRLRFLNEHPTYSMMRAFIVYLVFVSGLYIASGDPFSMTTSSLYVRLAGLVSLLGFVVGYDPTRFQQWLDIVPSPQKAKESDRVDTKTVTFHEEKTQKVTVETPPEVATHESPSRVT